MGFSGWLFGCSTSVSWVVVWRWGSSVGVRVGSDFLGVGLLVGCFGLVGSLLGVRRLGWLFLVGLGFFGMLGCLVGLLVLFGLRGSTGWGSVGSVYWLAGRLVPVDRSDLAGSGWLIGRLAG